MKIRVRSHGHTLTLLLPTRLLFSRPMITFGLQIGKQYSDAVPDIPPLAIDSLCKELHRIKRTYHDWELVHIETATGETVQVIL